MAWLSMTRQRPPLYFWKKIAAASPLMPPPTATRSYISPASMALAIRVSKLPSRSACPAPARRAPFRKSRREIGSLRPSRCSSTARLLSRRRRRAEPAREPRRHLLIEEAAVLALQNPVVLLRPDDEPRGDLLALHRRPELQRVVHRYPEVALAHGDEYRRVQVRRSPHRALGPPESVVFPRGAAHVALAVVVEVARRPLRLEIPFAGVAHQRTVARRGHGEPVGEMAAVTRAAGDLPGRIDEVEPLDRAVGGLVDVVRRPLERIKLDVLRNLLAVARRAPVVGHQDHVTPPGGAQEMRIPAQAKVVGPHVGRTAMDQHEQRIAAARVESRRHCVEAVNAFATGRCKPELAQRLPVDLCRPVSVELRQYGPVPRGRIDPDDLGWIRRTLPHRRHLDGVARRRRRDLQAAERAGRHPADLLLQAFGSGRAKQARVACVLSEEIHAAPI